VPVGYAAVRYQLANVNVVARRAFSYAIVVTSLTAFIGAVNYLNTLLPMQMGPFTSLILPGISSLLAVGIGTFVWKKTRESDVLKTEFISIISHKFRTPLTQIKWTVEMLLNSPAIIDKDMRHELTNVAESNKRLIELSNMLVATAEATNASDYDYSFARFPVIQNIEDIIRSHALEINKKELGIIKVFPLVNSAAITESGYLEKQQRQGELSPSSLIPPSVLSTAREVYVNADRERFRFVLHTLIENAIRYTPAKGTIRITIDNSDGLAHIIVADTGIGISEKEIRYVFTRFYRTDRAKVADTEGAGIGLYLSKVIVDRHGGKMSALSEGENKGSTFTVVVPLAF
jgi:signal transduction histidine kinase